MIKNNKIYPKQNWEFASPEEAGLDGEGLQKAVKWLDEHSESNPYRFVIVRHGRVVIHKSKNVEEDKCLPIASAVKSCYSNILGIAVEEKKIPSPDEKVVNYYPEMMEVTEGQGPKPGRYAFEKDKDITFKQLISNTSGYMKPGEKPGKVFHYQTYGMNILSNSLAKIYGLNNSEDGKGSPGFKVLLEGKLGRKIGAKWEYGVGNFNHPENARVDIFGNFCYIKSTALDLARLGWLWCNFGKWEQEQVIPEKWIRESVRTNQDILNNCSEDQWKYGFGFWTNSHNQLWPGMPTDAFTASGAWGYYISVFPSLDMVVVQAPGPFKSGDRGNEELVRIIINDCEWR